MTVKNDVCAPGTFNVPTGLMDTGCYAKKLQESTDPFEYLLAIKPRGPCFMVGENLQGYSAGTRAPPPELIGVETYLKTNPLITDSITGPLQNQSPQLPSELNNLLEIPECKRRIDSKFQSRRLRSQMPSYAPSRTDIITDRRKQVDLARDGRNTRQEMKDAYKKYQEGKFGDRTKGVLVPSSHVDCVSGSSDLQCLHVASTDNITGSGGASAPNTGGPLQNPSPVSNPNSDYLAVLNGTSGASQVVKGSSTSSVGHSAATIAAAKKIDQTAPFSRLLNEAAAQAGRGLEFYGYKSPCPRK